MRHTYILEPTPNAATIELRREARELRDWLARAVARDNAERRLRLDAGRLKAWIASQRMVENGRG